MTINQGFKAFTGGLLALVLLVSALPAQAADFTVNQSDSDCSDLVCDLVSAIETANASAEDDVIDLGDQTITLTLAYDNGGDMSTGLPTIVDAATAGRLRVQNGSITRSSDGGTPQFRLLYVAENADLSLDRVTLSNGHAPDGADGANGSSSGGAGDEGASGGAIYNRGNLNLAYCRLENNQAGDGGAGGSATASNSGGGSLSVSGGVGNEGGHGGAIYSAGSGDLRIMHSTFINNRAGDGGNGGAATATGTAGGDVQATGGVASRGGYGGAIYFDQGSLSILHSSLTGNRSGNNGTGGQAEATVNGGTSGATGGASEGTAQGGGAIYARAGDKVISHSTIAGNLAGNGGAGGTATATGGSSARAVGGAGSATGDGGAVFSGGGTLHITNSTLTGNRGGNAGGGGNATASTTSGDSQAIGGAGGTAHDSGGAITASGTDFSLVNSTVTDNRAGDGGAGGTATATGGTYDFPGHIVDDSGAFAGATGGVAGRGYRGGDGGQAVAVAGNAASGSNADGGFASATGGKGGAGRQPGAGGMATATAGSGDGTGDNGNTFEDDGADGNLEEVPGSLYLAQGTAGLNNNILSGDAGFCKLNSVTPTGTSNLATDDSCGTGILVNGTPVGDPADLMLDSGGLQFNGGPTQTIALLPGSPAIDAAGDCASLMPPITTDQRGVPRPQDAACDIGAFELITTPILDFGDAPAGYPVTLAENGAAHALGGPSLGAIGPDAEADGTASPDADADDVNATPDDEDAVPMILAAGATVSIPVSNASVGTVGSAWLNLNDDDDDDTDWKDAGEVLVSDASAAGGSFDITVPAKPGAHIMRLRTCNNTGNCNLPTGIALDGEVEDHLVTIQPTVTLNVDMNTISEDGGVAMVTASLNTARKSRDVTVTLGIDAASTAGASDYTPPADLTLSIPAGELISNALSFTALPDEIDEPDETLIVNIASVDNAVEAVDQQQTITIADNDGPPVLTVTGSSASETDGTLSFTVTKGGDSPTPVTVDYATADGSATAGSDYTASNGSLSFAPGELMQTVSVPLTNDALFEDNETLTLTLSNVSANANIGTASATGTITSEDARPVVTITSAPGAASTAKVGDSNVVMLAVDVAVQAYPEKLNVTRLELTAAGSGHDRNDVTRVRLWKDNGDNSFSTADTELLTGVFDADNGKLTFTGNEMFDAGSTTRLYVTYDFNTSLAALALPMMAGLPLLAGLGLMGLGGRRRRALALCLILLSPIALTGCPGAPEGAAAYVAYKEITDDDDDDDAVQTETFRVAPSAVTASFPSVEKPTVTGLPIVGDTVTVSE